MLGSSDFLNKLAVKRGAQGQLEKQLQQEQDNIVEAKILLEQYEQARLIIQEVAQRTQDELKFHISGLVSLALEAVFDEPYKLVVDFVQRRGKTEADLWFERDGNFVHPLSATGGGPVDIAAFALRVASWSLKKPRSRNVLIIDEPFRFLSKQYQPRAGQMLKELSSKLKLQIIMVSHNKELIEAADKRFVVTQKKGVSYVE